MNQGAATAARDGLGDLTNSILGAPTPEMVYVQAGETVDLGSSALQAAGGSSGTIRVYPIGTDPNSATAPAPLLDCAADQSGRGVIASRTEEQDGPAPNPGGYTPCTFTPTTTGIYPVVFRGYNATNGAPGTIAAPTTGSAQGAVISMWDVTVRNAAGAIQPGRMFASSYSLRTGTSNSADVQTYVYTNTGYEYQVTLFDQAGLNWLLDADDLGVVNSSNGQRLFASFNFGTGNVVTHTEAELGSQFPGDILYPEFVSPPDPLVISGPGGLAQTEGFATQPITSASNPLANQTFTGSAGQAGATNQGQGGTISFSSLPAMNGQDYNVTLDLNNDGTFGNANDVVAADAGTLSSSGNSYAWDGHDANGAVPACGTYPYQVTSTLSEVHFAMSDVENSGGTQIRRLSLPTDPSLPDPLAASYNDIDPFQNIDVTNASPSTVTNGLSGAGFHAWTGSTGDNDDIDTWARLPDVAAQGTIHLACADMSIQKTATTDEAVPGANITYQLVVRNNGPDTATNVVVSDPLPAGLTFVSADGCTVSGQTVTCTVASMRPGESRPFDVTASVDSSLGAGTITNTATVRNDTPDPNPGNNSDGNTEQVRPEADLAIVKTATSKRLVPGTNLTYKLVVSNLGPSPAHNLVVSDPLPAGLSFVSARGCTFASGRVICRIAEMDKGGSQTFTVTTRVRSSVGDSVTNTASVTSDTPDPNPSNNRSSATVPPGPESDLSITKTPSTGTVQLGGQLFYTEVVKNNGPSDATGVMLNDVPPPGLTLTSARPSQGTCSLTDGKVACKLGTIAAGGSAQVLVQATAHTLGKLDNTATVSSTSVDPNPGNNSSTGTITVTPDPVPPTADLGIVKTSNHRSVLGSGAITYTIRVTNHGPGVATGVQVVDTPSLPVKITSARSTSSGVRCTTTVPIRCDLGTLASGASITVKVVARPMAPGSLKNSASVTGDVPDPNPGNNMSTTTTTVQGLLKVRKVASAANVRAGGTLSYRITVTNASSFPLRSVKVCDSLPSGIVFVSSTPKSTLSGGKRCWAVGTLGAGKSRAIALRARVLGGTAGRRVNTATATAPNARGARSKAATGTAAIRVLAARPRAGGVTG